jgi:hypothetical protein
MYARRLPDLAEDAQDQPVGTGCGGSNQCRPAVLVKRIANSLEVGPVMPPRLRQGEAEFAKSLCGCEIRNPGEADLPLP